MSVCSRCGATFGCALADPGTPAPCWCMALAPAVPLAPGARCWCPQCLKKHLDTLAAPAPADASRRSD